MDFIVDQQAKNSVEIDRLNELFGKAEHRFDRDERILKMMIRAGRRERRTRSEADDRLNNALAELAEAQTRTEASFAHTDGKLDALVDIVRQGQSGRSQ